MQSHGFIMAFWACLSLASSFTICPLLTLTGWLPFPQDFCCDVTCILIAFSLPFVFRRYVGAWWPRPNYQIHLERLITDSLWSIHFVVYLKDNCDNLYLNLQAICPLRLITNFDTYFYEHRIHKTPLYICQPRLSALVRILGGLMPTPCDLGGITSPLHLSFYVCEVGVTSLRVKGATDVMCESWKQHRILKTPQVVMLSMEKGLQ